MHLHSFCVRNYRRLRDVRIELEPEASIFVGSNNSGKTSAAHVFNAFLGPSKPDRFSVHDFSAACWPVFDTIGASHLASDTPLPTIVLDLWFKVDEGDLHRVVKLLPSLDWKDAPVGVRLEYAPRNPTELLSNFREAKTKAAKFTSTKEDGKPDYHPWPPTLTEYLKRRLGDEYKIYYYVLDYEQFAGDFKQKEGYIPQELGDATESGATILRSVLRIDFLDAQRYLSDEPKGQAENLSRRLSRFYERNLEKHDEDFTAVAALAKSEEELNKHLAVVFGPTLKSLNALGYPGFADPHLVIKSAFDPESILTKNASVHYALCDPGNPVSPETPPTLPDKYNGLGFKNLIYMVVEILDFHQQWAEEKEKRPPLHLVLIEEPEAHLHAQLQQVFIKKIRDILPPEALEFTTQMIVTTHSPHIIYESGFKPIRYFRRKATGHCSDVLNLSRFYENEKTTREFLTRYMKLTHCDLFFADAAIIVEGNVERLLLPLMIEEEAPALKSSYLSILELGGAFAHKFRTLVHFLDLTTLVITDLDSVFPKPDEKPTVESADGAEAADGIEDGEETAETAKKGVCMADETDSETSNQFLIQWLPKLKKVSELLAAKDEQKCTTSTAEEPAKVRVAFQTREKVTWKKETAKLAGRTFEEAFSYQNLEWCQKISQKDLGLRVVRKKELSLKEVTEEIHKRVKSDSFKKTGFALALDFPRYSGHPRTWF